MIRASKGMSFGGVSTYFRRDYRVGAYYIADRLGGDGTWQGRGAERLGLRGKVEENDFFALLRGQSPRDGRQLVAAEKGSGKRRVAWDFQAAPDKSVSLAALVGGDERVVDAHLAAARRAFEMLEEHALVKNRKRTPIRSGNLAIARFDHDSSRALDPHLHSHHVIVNLTERPGRRRGKSEWRALETREMFANQTHATAVYQAELARELQALGYEVRVNAKGFVRIAGISDEVLKAFSKRRDQILAEVARRGGSGTAEERERAALYTRAPKQRDIDPAVLRAAWRAEVAGHGLDLEALRRAAEERRAAVPPVSPAEALAAAHAAVAWAADHLAERQASFRVIDLETHALRHGTGRGVGLADVRAAMTEHPGLLAGADGRMTTRAALALEHANLTRLREGLRSGGRPILARRYQPAPGSTLGSDQLRVIRHVLGSRAQVLGIEGKPGTGKTHTLGVVREAAEGAGWTVRGFAVSTGAVAQLREVGIAAATLKSLAAEPAAASQAPRETARETQRQLWIVDEASLLGNRDAGVVLERAHDAGARLVFVGDRRQHHAVEAGAPWAAFQDAGLRPARLETIRRQEHTDLLAAVRLTAAGRAGDAIRHLDAHGHVVEIGKTAERHAAMAKEFAAAPRHTLMIAPSRAERRELNFLARRELVALGGVAREGITVEVAVSKGVTLAQRAEVRYYEVGDVVSYVRAAPAHQVRAGDTARVVAVDAERHTVLVERHRDGARFSYDPRRLRGGDLARAETRELAVGDRVQWRRADRGRDIPNGATATVREVGASGRIVLELEDRRGRIVTLEARGGPLPLDYAYAVTSHAAQGATARRVLATIDTRHGVELVNRQQAHVTLSRASHQLKVYTDSRAALPGAVNREAHKATALEVQPAARSRSHRDASPPPTRSAARDATRGPGGAAAVRPARGTGRSEPAGAAGAPGRGAAGAGTGDVGRVGGDGGGSARDGDAAAERGAAAERRARAGAGRRADRPLGARDPRPRPHPLREPRAEPRHERAPDRSRDAGHPADRHGPRGRNGGPGERRDPARDRAAVERPRALAADPGARRLIDAARRWQRAQGNDKVQRTAALPPAPALATPRLQVPPARAAVVSAPGRGGAGGGGAGGGVDGAGGFSLAAARQAAALARAEDPERRLVRLIAEVGVHRAMALLPAPLARAVGAIHEVARMLAGIARGR